ncbi:MAG: DUF1385 domain-containing protein [Chloroflexi bacterium]|nr:DUF1385 domain-containing protein [Chloroflexota bacterium]
MTEPKILYGGQAVIEGVMMRGRNFVSCAVRRETGEIILKSESIPKGVYAGVWSKTPFLRALPLLWDTLVLGTRMLMWAANVQMKDEMGKERAKKGKEGKEGIKGTDGTREESEIRNLKSQISSMSRTNVKDQKSEDGLSQNAIFGSLALSLGLGLAIFFALPVLVANFLGNYGVTPFWNNIAEGVIRLALFLAYLIAIGRIPEIQRVFMYHGAEHKTIAAYEASAQLVPAEVQKFSKEHPRCGTGFLLTVVVISIIFFVVLGDLSLGLRLVSRIVLIPFVAAVSYELIRFASQHRRIFLFDWFIVRPSLALQALTTRQPTDDMIEVAVAAFQDVRGKEVGSNQ